MAPRERAIVRAGHSRVGATGPAYHLRAAIHTRDGTHRPAGSTAGRRQAVRHFAHTAYMPPAVTEVPVHAMRSSAAAYGIMGQDKESHIGHMVRKGPQGRTANWGAPSLGMAGGPSAPSVVATASVVGRSGCVPPYRSSLYVWCVPINAGSTKHTQIGRGVSKKDGSGHDGRRGWVGALPGTVRGVFISSPSSVRSSGAERLASRRAWRQPSRRIPSAVCLH